MGRLGKGNEKKIEKLTENDKTIQEYWVREITDDKEPFEVTLKWLFKQVIKQYLCQMSNKTN